MIAAKNVTKRFDGFPALDGASLKVNKGAVYGLVGPNGAGKSTMIRHLNGVYRPDGGSVSIDGRSVWENTALKQRVLTIPDDLFYFMQASVRDMAKLYRGFYPRFNQERYERLQEAFPSVDPKTPLRRLSKGMQKQAAFWLAICCQPDVMILDEPVDGLDPVMRRQVWSLLLGDVADREMTVLVSSHNLRELEDVCSHVGIMNQGKVVLERSLSDLQGGVTKLQAVWEGDAPPLPAGMTLLHQASSGRLQTLILRGSPEEITKRYLNTRPIFMETLPLSLEEIFIYELGGADYGVKEILL